MTNEHTWDKLLQIQTCGRDDTNADQYHHPYEPTPYSVLERLADSGFFREGDVVLDYGCGKGRVGFFLGYRTKARVIGIEYDKRIYEGAVENAYKFLGCGLGMWVIYEVDTRFIRFDTKTAKWWAQIIKLAVGFGLLLLVMEGSKPLFNLIFKGNYIAYAIRYFLTVLFAGAVWPLTFKWFARLGAKK